MLVHVHVGRIKWKATKNCTILHIVIVLYCMAKRKLYLSLCLQ